MKENETFNINVVIADNLFSLTIKRTDEERYRKAAKQLNERFIKYQQKYPSTPHAKLFAMIAFEFATEYLKMEGQTDMAPFLEKVQVMDNLLEAYLQQAEN